MKIDLAAMELDEMLALRKSLDAAIEKKKKQNRTKVLAKIEKLLAENGMTVSDLKTPRKKAKSTTRRKTSATKGRKVPPKYRNPKNRRETWTGRGRKPKWVEAYLAAGGNIEDLSIK